ARSRLLKVHSGGSRPPLAGPHAFRHSMSAGLPPDYTNPVERVTLDVRGRPREYLFFAPDGPGRPLVVFLHGAGGTAAWADAETGWSVLAAREHFALALPEGLPPDPDRPPKFLTNPPRWNDGSPGPTGAPSAADDVAFLAALL